MATIIQIANADRSLSLFARGLRLSGLQEKIDEGGSFTIIGVLNIALQNLMALPYNELLLTANKQKLFNFLAAYILCGENLLSDFRDHKNLRTLTGNTANIIINKGEIYINGTRLLGRDWQGSNGVIHVVDSTYVC